MKFKFMLLLLIYMFTCSVAESAKMKVLNSDDRLPLSGVSILSEHGVILGITDANGCIELSENIEYPITLRCVGHKVTKLYAPSETAVLPTVAYVLPEVNIDASTRPIKRIICLVRGYMTGTFGTDTLQAYSEYMMEAFRQMGKVKGFHKSDEKLSIRNKRNFGRIVDTKENIDSVYIPDEYDPLSMLALLEALAELPETIVYEPEAIRRGEAYERIPGQYRTKNIFRKGGTNFSMFTNFLCDQKETVYSPTVFKLFGFTIDFKRMESIYVFQSNQQGAYDITDLRYGMINFNALARGKAFKWILKTKEPIELLSNIEIYPTEVTYITTEEYKKLRKERGVIPFQTPEYVLPEIPTVTRLKQRISHDK